MNRPLRILIVDDSEEDAGLIVQALHRNGYDAISKRVDCEKDMRNALESQEWDVIASDHVMPRFSAPASLLLATQLRPLIPFIIVSGEIDIALTVSLMRNGAKDYITKKELLLLAPAIERELHEVQLQREIKKIEIALKRSEIRYRRLFETAEDGILILDATTGQILDVNPYLIRILDYTKEDFLGKMLWNFGFFHDEQESRKAFAELQDKGYIRYKNLPLETKTGKKISVEFVSNTYMVNDLKVAQCNIRDISKHVMDEKEILKLNEELEQRVKERTYQLEALNKELETFSYSVSHDLRAPLRRIMVYLEDLKADIASVQSSTGKELLEKIRINTKRMDRLISALLNLSHFSLQTLVRTTVDLSAMARHVADELAQNQPDRNVSFAIADGIIVQGDALLLRSVLENLIGNAWKYTSRNDTATIEFGVLPQDFETSIYFIRDDGVGFDMTYSNKLFGAFQRLHNEKEFPGIGIGLATVQRIITRHNGRVWAESTLGVSTVFYFTLGKG
jgi:PAS domain S-box-containing protein